MAEEKRYPRKKQVPRQEIHHRKPKNVPVQITMPTQKKFSKSFKKIRDKAAKSGKQSAEDKQDRGQLGPLTTSILMRILYAASEARLELSQNCQQDDMFSGILELRSRSENAEASSLHQINLALPAIWLDWR